MTLTESTRTYWYVGDEDLLLDFADLGFPPKDNAPPVAAFTWGDLLNLSATELGHAALRGAHGEVLIEDAADPRVVRIRAGLLRPGECDACDAFAERLPHVPSHRGSRTCRVKRSLAAGGDVDHCTCGGCF